ncbi:MAG TPA: hypothetical protein ENJ41_00595 [Oceanospirillales bacterium]|nr:hypothetical protein [Oceanospirillales bacterium]
MNKILIAIQLNLPVLAIANSKPSLNVLWLEMALLIVVIMALKISNLANSSKLIIFVSYVLLGILTKTTWIPVILCAALYYYFKTQDNQAD